MKAKFRFNLERTEHDIEVHEDGTVTITAESGAELTFESVKALALEFAASRNTPANILKNFELSQVGDVYVFAQRSGTAGYEFSSSRATNFEHDEHEYENEDDYEDECEDEYEDDEDEEEIDEHAELRGKVESSFDADVNDYTMTADLVAVFELDNRILFDTEANKIIRERANRRIATAAIAGGHVGLFKFVNGEEPTFERIDTLVDGLVLPVGDVFVIVAEEDVNALRTFVVGEPEQKETAVTESPLFSKMFR